jgi:sulfoxide reductase heme-binding subunit YedZ
MRPFADYGGRFSPLKTAVFAALFMPAISTAIDFAQGDLGPRPMTEVIHALGLWTIRLLFLALAVSPLRQILAWPRLMLVRRMLGVAAFAYAAAHLVAYAADQGFNLATVVSEIVLRIYLTIGFAALLGLAALAATSTDGMIRRLGRRWQQLHRLVYAIAVLAAIHFFMQSKLDVFEPTVMAGLLLWLLGFRAVTAVRARAPAAPLWVVAVLGFVASAATALGEALYFRILSGVDPLRVLAANFSPYVGMRPAAIVLVASGAVTAAAAVRALVGPTRKPRRAPSPAPV